MFDFNEFATGRDAGINEIKKMILDRLNHQRSDLSQLLGEKMDKRVSGRESMEGMKVAERVEELKWLLNKIK